MFNNTFMILGWEHDKELEDDFYADENFARLSTKIVFTKK